MSVKCVVWEIRDSLVAVTNPPHFHSPLYESTQRMYKGAPERGNFRKSMQQPVCGWVLESKRGCDGSQVDHRHVGSFTCERIRR